MIKSNSELFFKKMKEKTKVCKNYSDIITSTKKCNICNQNVAFFISNKFFFKIS